MHRNCQARREPQRSPGNHYRGALSQPHSVCAEIKPTGRKRGVGCPPHCSTRGLGEHRKLPIGGPGRSPGRKWILCIFEVRKKPSGTPFSIILNSGGPPKRCGARENFPPFLPLLMGLGTPLQRCGMSPAIRDHTVLPANNTSEHAPTRIAVY